MIKPGAPQSDPLDAARRFLDFEAIAKEAPTSKSILFKAQTIVPMVPVRPWEKFGKAGVIAASALLLLFAPILPATTQLSLARVQFEKSMELAEAQSTVYAAARELPQQLLIEAEFVGSQGSDEGRLVMTMAALGHSPDELGELARDGFADAGGAQPFVTGSSKSKLRSWRSIPQAVMAGLKRDDTKVSHYGPSNNLAQDILANSELIEQALATDMLAAGYELESLEFSGDGPHMVRKTDSFLLPAWPQWVEVQVTGYTGLPDRQQQDVRAVAAGSLDSMLLGGGTVQLAEAPGAELPVLINVADLNGAIDPIATRLVQASFGQLYAADPPMGKFETESMVDAAVADTLGELAYDIAYQQQTMFEPGVEQETYSATVTITGDSRNRLREFTIPEQESPDVGEF